MGQMIQHSLHKQSYRVFVFFLKQKSYFPKVIYGEQPHGCGCHFTRSSELGELSSCTQTGKIPCREREKLISRVLLIFLASSNSSWRLLWTNRKSSLQGVLGSSDVIRKKSPPSWLLLLFSGFARQHIFNHHCVEPWEGMQPLFPEHGTKVDQMVAE